MNDPMRKAFEEITYSSLKIAGSHTGHGLHRKENGEYVSDLLEDHWNTFQEGWGAAIDMLKHKTSSQYSDVVSDGDVDWTALYTSPPPREPLTVVEIMREWSRANNSVVDFAKAIEAKLKEKNT